MSNIELLEKKALLAFKPPKKLTLSEWADENAFLSAESSAEGGRLSLIHISSPRDYAASRMPSSA